MSGPNFSTEAAAAGTYPSNRFNQRERKLLESISDKYVYAVVAAGSFTTAGGDASETITVSGALSTDLAFVVVKTAGATPRSIVAAASATGQINVTMSGDPSTDHVLAYQILRAV